MFAAHAAADLARGAARVEPPEQEVEPDPEGGFRLVFAPRLASEDAIFCVPFVQRAFVPESCSSWFLPRVVGVSRAKWQNGC